VPRWDPCTHNKTGVPSRSPLRHTREQGGGTVWPSPVAGSTRARVKTAAVGKSRPAVATEPFEIVQAAYIDQTFLEAPGRALVEL